MNPDGTSGSSTVLDLVFRTLNKNNQSFVVHKLPVHFQKKNTYQCSDPLMCQSLCIIRITQQPTVEHGILTSHKTVTTNLNRLNRAVTNDELIPVHE